MHKPRKPQGIQKVETGLQVAFLLAGSPGPMALGELARRCRMAPSNMHRYLVSLCRTGLVEQVGSDGRYDLGQGALTLGFAAMSRLDEYRVADGAIRELHRETGLAVAIISWGSHGPTIVRRLDPPAPLIVTTRIGAAISVLNSAAGRIFAAFLPSEVVAPVIKAELAAGGRLTSMGKRIHWRQFAKIVRDARQRRIARVSGDYIAGFDALSAPVFDHAGNVTMTLSLLAPTGAMELSYSGSPARMLQRVAKSLSERLGFSERASEA